MFAVGTSKGVEHCTQDAHYGCYSLQHTRMEMRSLCAGAALDPPLWKNIIPNKLSVSLSLSLSLLLSYRSQSCLEHSCHPPLRPSPAVRPLKPLQEATGHGMTRRQCRKHESWAERRPWLLDALWIRRLEFLKKKPGDGSHAHTARSRVRPILTPSL